MFRKPTIWDIVSISVGIIGLGLTGSIVINLSPSGAQFLFLIVSMLLLAIVVYLLRGFREKSLFELKVQELSVQLNFEKDAILNNRLIPKATLIRSETFRPRKNAPLVFKRYQNIYDPVGSESKLNSIPENYSVSCDVYDKKSPLDGRSKIIATRKNIRFTKEFSDFRDLYFSIELPEAARNHNFAIKENMQLQSSYTQDEEFYNVNIADFARVRKFKVQTRGIIITDARYEIRIGISDLIKMTEVEVLSENDEYSFSFEINNLRPGARLSIKWHWLLNI